LNPAWTKCRSKAKAVSILSLFMTTNEAQSVSE